MLLQLVNFTDTQLRGIWNCLQTTYNELLSKSYQKKEKSLPLSVEYSTDNSRLDSLINSYLHYRYSHAYLHHNDVLRRNARVHDGCNALPDYSSGFRLYNFLSTKFPFLFDIILPITSLSCFLPSLSHLSTLFLFVRSNTGVHVSGIITLQQASKQNICCLLLIIRKTRSNYTILIRFPTNTAATGITTTQAIAPNIIDTQFWNNIFEFNNVSSV